MKLLKEHGSLEAVVEHLREKQASREDAEEEDGKKKKGGVHIPEDWPWEKAKELFLKPDVTPADDLEVLVSCFLVRYHEADEVIVGVESTGC